MAGYRLLRLVLHFFAALLVCVAVFPILNTGSRNRYVQRWSAGLLSVCGVAVRVSCRHEIAPNALVVANHLSWLDIYLINSLSPCRFIAKADIRDWPLIGWLSRMGGTVFIERGKQRDLRKTLQNLASHLHGGERFAFFPEGTTAAQGQLLPFHANLFEAAINARIPIQPYALRYVDANERPHAGIDFSGDTTFFQSVCAVLRARRITAELIVLPPLESAGMHRRELAHAARKAVAQALGADTSADCSASGPAGAQAEAA